nr:ERF family protein [Patescibacteria group bacterium]
MKNKTDTGTSTFTDDESSKPIGLSLTDKLIKIQTELKSPKNQKNTYGGYNYRSCEDILEAVKPLLNKYDLAIKIRDNIEMIGDRYYVKATVIIGNGKNITKTSAYARETLD